MKIILATPLYPPEISESARYVKELAKRLIKRHEITVVAYAHLPENVPGVRIISVNKRRPLPFRLVAYTLALWRAARAGDVIYAENGASVELPAGLVALITRRPLIFHMGDKNAEMRASENKLLGFVGSLAMRHAQRIITDMPVKRPIIWPFEPFPKTKFNEYDKSWDEHTKTLEEIFKRV